MIAIVHSIYSQSVHAPARDAGLMDNDAERYCTMSCCTIYSSWNNFLCHMNVIINVLTCCTTQEAVTDKLQIFCIDHLQL